MDSSHDHNSCSFDGRFAAFARHSDPELDRKFITLSQSDEWMQRAGVFGDITPSDTFFHFSSMGEMVNLFGYSWFLQRMADAKEVDLDELRMQMACCAKPNGIPMNQSVDYNTVSNTNCDYAESCPHEYCQGANSNHSRQGYNLESLYLGNSESVISNMHDPTVNTSSYDTSRQVHFDENTEEPQEARRPVRSTPRDSRFVTEYMGSYTHKKGK